MKSKEIGNLLRSIHKKSKLAKPSLEVAPATLRPVLLIYSFQFRSFFLHVAELVSCFLSFILSPLRQNIFLP